jgi:hypothetical protein
MEPRRWAQLPVNTSLLGVGSVRTQGHIDFDPALKLEDVSVESTAVVLSFLRSFDLLGQSARLDLRLPYKENRWEGLLSGRPASTERKGLGDPWLRVSINFLGSPALTSDELRAFRASRPVNTVVGAALAVTVPLGSYEREKLLNLGENRFTFRPQLGFVHNRGYWSYELTASVFLYTDNNDFFGDNKREQDPLYGVQTHLSYTSPHRWWISLGAAFGSGGETRINGEDQGDKRQDLLFGASAGFSVTASSSIKATYLGHRTQEDVGQSTDGIALSWLTRF